MKRNRKFIAGFVAALVCANSIGTSIDVAQASELTESATVFDDESYFKSQFFSAIQPSELEEIDSGNYCRFVYNEEYYRIGKEGSAGNTVYSYDEYGRLYRECRDGDIEIQYCYNRIPQMLPNGIWEQTRISGFIWNNREYNYEYDEDGNVSAVCRNDDELVSYSYEDGTCVISVSDDCSVVRNGEADMVARLNMIRYQGYQYDIETGYYFTGSLYYNPQSDDLYFDESVFSNSGSYQRDLAATIIANVNTQTTNLMNNVSNGYGRNITSTSSNWYSGLSNVEVVARCLFGEAGSEANDIKAVSWVILNQFLANSTTFHGSGRTNTIYNIVTNPGNFSVITGNSSSTQLARILNLSSSSSTLSKFYTCTWDAAAIIALSGYTTSQVNYASVLSKPANITNHKYYMSVKTFYNSVTWNQGQASFGNSRIYQVAIPISGVTISGPLTSSQYTNYLYHYNIYFNY